MAPIEPKLARIASSTASRAKRAAAAVKTPAAAPASPDRVTLSPAAQGFHYNARPIQDHRGAVAWKPGSEGESGVQANEAINADYHHLNQEMGRFLDNDKLPPVTDFAGGAKHGSFLVGNQVRNLEDVQKALKGDVKAAADASRNLAAADPLKQGTSMGLHSAARNLVDEHPVDMTLSPGFTLAKVGVETGTETLATLNKMRDVLVEGNTTIHNQVAPAYDAFLKGGMESLREAGYSPGSERDPHGLVTKAFEHFQGARESGQAALAETDPQKRAALLQERKRHVDEGNLNIVTQEQLTLEQPHLYGDKLMGNAVRSLGGLMSLDDPNGRYNLLPQGGDWTDFKTRMGYREVPADTPDAITVNGVSYRPDPSRVGTVSHYFANNFSGDKAVQLNATAPGPLVTAPETATGKSVDSLAVAWQQDDRSQFWGSAVSLPGRMTSDALTLSGAALQEHAGNGNSLGAQAERGLAKALNWTGNGVNSAAGWAEWGVTSTGQMLDSIF